MIRLARLAIGRPRAALAAAVVVAVALTLVGAGVWSSLSPTVTTVPGTESSRAQVLANGNFGPTQLVPILLQGPQAELERQGPPLVRDLSQRPHTRVLSAWDAGAASLGLRPSRNAAMILVSVDRSEQHAVNTDQPQIDRLVAHDIAAPVRASVTGQPSIDRALKDEAISTTRRSELIAVGILFVLLLLGLRSALAAVTVTLIGAATALCGFGVMAILGRFLATDPIGVALASMSGLALGVGYSLMILDRFHQESRDAGSDRRSASLAACDAVATSGRAVLLGGTALIVALLIATALGPTKVLISLGIGVLLCCMLAVGASVVVMPAALVLFGVDLMGRGLPAPALLTRGWDRLVGGGAWVRRHAVIAGGLATAALVALAVPAYALDTGPPDVSQLPKDNSARLAFEEVARVMGPGWPTPYNIIVVSRHGPITTPQTLAKLDALETEIAKDPAVASVAGPGALSAQTKPLGKLPTSLAESSKLLKNGKRDLGRLANGLGAAGAGAAQLQSGLATATAGAGKLHSGSGEAQGGAGQLHAGLAAAHSGSAKLSAGLIQALAGAKALKSGASQALAGSVALTNGITSARTPSAAGVAGVKQLSTLTAQTNTALGGLGQQAQSAGSELAGAEAALTHMTTGKNDPQYGEALAAVRRAQASVGGVSSGLSKIAPTAASAAEIASSTSAQLSFLDRALGELNNGSSQLQAGLLKLYRGNSQLAAGVSKLSGGGGELQAGLKKLRDGAGKLEAGLGELTNGTGQLQSGLAGGVAPTGQLVNGLGIMQKAVTKFSGQLPSPKELEELNKQSPGLFNSGYFLLAAIQGAPPSSREAAELALNVRFGGNAGQIVVVPRYSSRSKRTADLGERLQLKAKRFAYANNLSTGVGGPAGNLHDLTSVANDRLPWVLLVVAVAIAAVLMVALRAVLIPIVAVLFNMLAAIATFGVLALLFGKPGAPLGGPGYLDPMSIIGIFAVIFGLSTIFMAVLLTRTREELIAGADVDHALDVALRRTAASSTGAGLLMIAAIIPFATTGLLPVRQFGLAMIIAVAIDVFIVRPVLMPAAVALLGPASWWPTRTGSGPAPTRTLRPGRRRRTRLHLPPLHRPGHPAH